MKLARPALLLVVWLMGAIYCRAADDSEHPTMTWVKRHPRPAAQRPSPKMGYECAYGYDPTSRLLIRYGGHNQGGGGEQNSEVWTYDLGRDVWDLIEPNDAPPGVCCAQQNVFHDALGCFVRFPAFSASHGWQSLREVWLKDSAAWTFDPATGKWQNMRPLPAPELRPLRGAAYVADEELIVIHGGEGASHGTVLYDLYTNTWHELAPKGGPENSVSQPGFTYDPVNRVFVLFGSQFGDDPRTWLYDLSKNEWRVLATATHPPSDKSSPILAADTRNGIVLASVKGPDGLECWALDVAKTEWRRLDVRYEPEQNDEGANGDRNRVLLYLDRNLFVLECRTKNEQQLWTFRYADAPQPLPAPRGLLVALQGDDEVRLRWAAAERNDEWRYNIYRADDAVPWQREWKRIAEKQQTTTFVDRIDRGNVKKPLCYRVTAVDRAGKESPPSRIAYTRPPTPAGVTVRVERGDNGAARVRIGWEQPTGNSAVQMLIERAAVRVYSTDEASRIRSRLRSASDLAVGRVRKIGRFQRVSPARLDVGTGRYIETVDLTAGQSAAIESPIYERELRGEDLHTDGKPYPFAVYAYRAVAVNRWGQESGTSAAWFTFPATVQSVFAKEEGDTTTRIRWQAQAGATGYHVYRHDGRYDSDQIVRLTDKPIQQTEYLDQAAGSESRRYEIVAVDALGQEGAPSQPVWSRREWQRFYLPYTGEWHQ